MFRLSVQCVEKPFLRKKALPTILGCAYQCPLLHLQHGCSHSCRHPRTYLTLSEGLARVFSRAAIQSSPVLSESFREPFSHRMIENNNLWTLRTRISPNIFLLLCKRQIHARHTNPECSCGTDVHRYQTAALVWACCSHTNCTYHESAAASSTSDGWRNFGSCSFGPDIIRRALQFYFLYLSPASL